MFDQLLKRLSLTLGFVTFGSVLAVSLLSGTDPLWAVARAVGGTLALLAGFGVTSRLVLWVLGVGTEISSPSNGEAQGEEAAPAPIPAAGKPK
jgi:hypothetical protein